jgi:protein-S-isoprenylcysteine O-methyltransferase Ste14
MEPGQLNEVLRLGSLALYAVGPLLALGSLWSREFKPAAGRVRVQGWRWYVPSVLLPIEWLLPPVLIALGVGEVPAGWTAVRLLGFAVGLGGAALIVWASLLLGKFLIHEAALLPEHTLVTAGPYRFVRHPVYSGYLALLLGTGVAGLNVWLLLLWPVSCLGILIQAGAEEQLLQAKFRRDHEEYVNRTGRLIPRLR